MIKPKKLVVQNFMSIGAAQVDLADQGLVAIQGVNKDDPTALSNGAGKSSIVDAISWCLFGATARGVGGDAVVNIKAGKGTVVELEVEIDGDVYHIMRGRKHRTLRNRVQIRCGMHDITLGTDRQTQQRINNLLGCTLEVFNAAIYMGQENMPDLPAMTDKQLKSVLEEVLSLNKLDAAMEEVNSRISRAEDELKAKDKLIMALSTDIWKMETDIKIHRDRTDTLIASKIMIGEQIEDKVLNHKLEMDNFRIKIAKAKDEADKLPKPDDIDAREKELTAKYKVSQDKWTKLHSDYKDIKAKLNHQITLVETNRNLKDDCPCCGKPKVSHESVIAETAKLEAEIAAAQTLVKNLREKLNTWSESLDQAWKKIQKDCAEARANAKLVEDKIRYADELTEQMDRFDRTTMDAIDRLKRLVEDNTENLRKERVAMNDKLDEVDIYQGRIDGLQLDQDELKAHLDDLGKVKYALGRKGFRGEILDEVTPYLNARTDHYLTALTNGMISASWSTIAENSDGEYAENFHIDIKHQSGIGSFSQLSGGEKRKVRLACAMALQDLVATRAVKPIQLFIADEIDNAIDEAGLELLMGVLESKARNIGSVFVISHNSLDDWARNHLVITKQDGVSTFKSH